MYFVDEVVKNLKAELARGAKLKCSKCNLKGAALGCYVKSCRRTYHVPCALDIPTCRWDHVISFPFKIYYCRIYLKNTCASLHFSKVLWDIHWSRRIFFCSAPSIQTSNFHVRNPGLRSRQCGSIPICLICMLSSLSRAIFSISYCALFLCCDEFSRVSNCFVCLTFNF